MSFHYKIIKCTLLRLLYGNKRATFNLWTFPLAVPSEPRGRKQLCRQGMERLPLCRYQQVRPGTRPSPRRSVPLGKGSLPLRADTGPFYYFGSLVDWSGCSVDRLLPFRALEPLAHSCRRWSYHCYWWSALRGLKSMPNVNGFSDLSNKVNHEDFDIGLLVVWRFLF